MVIRQTRRRVAICLAQAQDGSTHKADRVRLMAEYTGDVVATYTSTSSSSPLKTQPSPPSLIELMAAANRDEFDAVVADFKAVCPPPWSVDRVVGRLQALGIAAVDINDARMTRLDWLLHLLPAQPMWRDHGRRVSAGIAAAKARWAAATGHQHGQASSGGR